MVQGILQGISGDSLKDSLWASTTSKLAFNSPRDSCQDVVTKVPVGGRGRYSLVVTSRQFNVQGSCPVWHLTVDLLDS